MMNAWETLCPGCFAEKGAVAVCPYCGYDESERRTPLVLPHRTVLNGQFIVGKVLGKPGGFGITYLGWDINLATLVAVKEYLPRDYAGRDSDHASVMAHSREDASLFRFGLEQFLQEARTLARFDHPNVVRTRSFFEQNGTAYLVMDYLQGVNLSEHLASMGGRLNEQQAGEIMLPILDGLQEVHAKGFLHRDIKPQNIYVTSTGRPILLDFGAARQAMGERSRSLSVVLTPGFSPYEQYHRRGEQGPWTDIYALAATYYYLLTGQAPPDAPERVATDELIPLRQLAPIVSTGLESAIMQSLSLEATGRPQDVFIFRDILYGRTVAAAASTPPPAATFAAAAAPPPLPVNAVPPVIAPTPPPVVAARPAEPTPVLPPDAVPPRYAPQGPAYPPQHYPQQQPPPAAKKSSAGTWVAVAGILLVVAVAGWYFLGGTEEPAKKTAPIATPPAKSAPSDVQTIKPTDKQPFEPLPPQKPVEANKPPAAAGPTPSTPNTPSEQAKPPAEVTPPPAEPPAQPRQQPAVRQQPPANKPTTPAPPKREQGSLW
jgi:serine/threonine protein kinase